MNEKKTYSSPQLKNYGTVQDLTNSFNKIGRAHDVFTGTPCVHGEIVGSIVAVRR